MSAPLLHPGAVSSSQMLPDSSLNSRGSRGLPYDPPVHQQPHLGQLHQSPSFFTSLLVTITQLWALFRKNLWVLLRSPKALIALLILPLVFIAIIWIVQSKINANNDVDNSGTDVPLFYQPCTTLDIYGNPDPSEPCVTLYFSPSTDPSKVAIMQSLAARTGLVYGVDIMPMTDIFSMVLTLATKIGRFDAAVTFDSYSGRECWSEPCQDVETEPEKIRAAELMKSLSSFSQQFNEDLARSEERMAASSCPFELSALNVTYTLWLNNTANYNDHVPGYVNTETSWQGGNSLGAIVPSRYWGLQHALNLAIADVMTGVGVPEIQKQMEEKKAARAYAKREALAKARKLKQNAELHDLEENDNTGSSPLYLTLFSFYNGRTGSSTVYDDNNDYSLADYANDSVTKFAGSSIISIAILVITLLNMQLLAYEKQARLIGILRIMGMNEFAYWFSWLLSFAMLAAGASLLATGMGRISELQIWQYCDFSIHFVAMFLYILSMCGLAMLFTSFIQRTIILNIIGFLLFFLNVISNVFFGSVFANYIYRPDLPNWLQIIYYVFPWFHYSKIWADALTNTSKITFNDNVKKITTHVQFRYTWAEITQTQRIYLDCAFGDEACCNSNDSEVKCFDAPSTASAMINLVILTSIYFFFSWYFAQVFGSSLGMNRRPWFLLTPSFWGFRNEQDEKLDQLAVLHARSQAAAGGQNAPASQELLRFMGQDRLTNEQYLSYRNQELRTYKLSKSYKKTSAVKEVTLKMQKDEVFVLLGANGAGKSSLVNCLTGLQEPTFGGGWMFGHAITNVSEVHRLAGVCMQDDILFEDLSARETLYVFAAVRGIPFSELRHTVNEKLKQFHMDSYADKAVRALSGGMKRRLSLSLSTLGDPSIVFLDEPTTGMDPVNRNKIWSTIKELKRNRIVVLTTHNMEEADYLGDTIALMSNGRMRAMGSALFLKNRYGAGYQLQLLVNPAFHQQIQTIIKQLLPGCEIIHSAGHNAVNADTVGAEREGAAAGNSGNNTSGHGNFTIGLKRKSLRQLPAFFQWMDAEEKRWKEHVARELASGQSNLAQAEQEKVLREWSLSNSTLEEVFLRLCAVEKNINERVAGSAEAEDLAEAERAEAAESARLLRADEDFANADHDDEKCMLCHTRVALEKVTLYSKSGVAVDFAHLLCAVCSHSPEAEQMVKGPASSLNATTEGGEGASATAPEDEAPIQLSEFADPHALAQFAPLIPAASAAAGPARATPASVGAYNVHAAPKGVNNELDIANSEDQFHLAWDAMSKSPPTILQQVRATYLKDFAKFRAEKKSFACKVIILAIMTFFIAYYTTTSNNQCPGGWIQAQKDWQQDTSTLPCNLLNVTYMFAQYYLNPIVPYGGKYNPQTCCSNPGALDTYSCQYPYYTKSGACGWVPNWPLSQGNQNFQPWTQDVLVPNLNPTPGSAARVRSGSDVPFANWTKPANYNYFAWQGWNLEFTDQTEALAYGKPAVIPPGPPTYIPEYPVDDLVARSAAYEATLPQYHGPRAPSFADMAPDQRQRAIEESEMRKWSPNQRKAMERNQAKKQSPRTDDQPLSPANQKLAQDLISNLGREELRSMIDEIQLVNLGAPDSTIQNINDLLWQNQLWVDKNATSIPAMCYSNSNQPPFAVVLFINSNNWYNILMNYMYSIFPNAGIEMLSAKPYPMANGVRVNETSKLNFVPDMEYRMYYWEQTLLPRSFFVVYNYTYNGDNWYLQCSNYQPDLMGSKDLSLLIHGMSHSYLQTRMESLYTNRLDLGRNVTFTTFWDNLIPTPNATICPNPKINAQFVQFPNVNYSPTLSSMSVAIALGLIVFVSLLNFPNTTSHVIYERESQLLHMMRISGMHDLAYWLGNYLFDFTVLIVWFAFVLIFGYAYGSIVFTGTNMGVLIFCCLCFIHYSITFAWLIAAFFSKRRIVLVACYLLVVLASFLAVTMDQYLPTTWNPIYLWIPPGAWIKCVSTIIRYNPKTISDAHGAQLLSAVLIMIAEGCIMFLVAMYWNILRYRNWAEVFLPASLRHCTKNNGDSADDIDAVELNQHSFAAGASEGLLSRQNEEEDIDVAAERVKVNQLAKSDSAAYPAILIHNLRKEFEGKATKKGKATPKKIAVDKLCLSVQYGECFGLLGPNGAGKSTTLSILTGLLDPTSGTAHLCGYNLLNSMQSIFTVLGICTQFDVVWEDLTVYDHLLFYARLKGVPRDWEKGLVQYIAELTELDGDPLMKPADSLSGGMKRRLSLGISLIGNPSIWLLDEPSTGLSPETRREIWNIIEKRKQRSRPRAGPNPSPGKAIVITTHMMEEADTLCDKIGIIAEGNLQCLGSSAHLKTRFGQGFKLTLHLSVEYERELVRDMLRNEVRAIGSAPAVGGGANNNNNASALNARALLVHEPGLADPIVNPNASPSPPPIAASSVAVGFVDPARQATALQHLNLLKFITKMAPHARLVNIDGKHLEFRLVNEHALESASSSVPASAVSSGVPSEGQTKEVLTVFNTMELHRHSLLPLFTILEWGLQQSSLEEVFMNIVHKYEADEEQ